MDNKVKKIGLLICGIILTAILVIANSIFASVVFTLKEADEAVGGLVGFLLSAYSYLVIVPFFIFFSIMFFTKLIKSENIKNRLLNLSGIFFCLSVIPILFDFFVGSIICFAIGLIFYVVSLLFTKQKYSSKIMIFNTLFIFLVSLIVLCFTIILFSVNDVVVTLQMFTICSIVLIYMFGVWPLLAALMNFFTNKKKEVINNVNIEPQNINTSINQNIESKDNDFTDDLNKLNK